MCTVQLKPSSFYWNIIVNMGWAAATMSGEHRPYERIKREFMETYSKQVAVEFNEWYTVRYRDLVLAYDVDPKARAQHYGNYGGDDSFGDMISHVIGLGAGYYFSVIADMKLLNNLEPVESFAYCIPHTYEGATDYKEMTLEYHQKQATKCVCNLADTLRDVEVELEDYVVIRELMTRFINLIEGNVLAAVGDLDFDRDYNRLYDFKSNGYQAQFANVLFDCKKYLG